jgi:hypothetical protein
VTWCTHCSLLFLPGTSRCEVVSSGLRIKSVFCDDISCTSEIYFNTKVIGLSYSCWGSLYWWSARTSYLKHDWLLIILRRFLTHIEMSVIPFKGTKMAFSRTRDLYSAMPAATRHLRWCGLIRRSATFSCIWPQAIISLGFVFTIYIEERLGTRNGRCFNSRIKN